MGRIRIRHGENEIELEGSDGFIKAQLAQFYVRLGRELPGSGKAPPPLREQLLAAAPLSKPGKSPTPAEFYRSMGKTDGLSQILVFGKYLG